MRERRGDSNAFKEAAAQLVNEPDRSVLQVAQGLGISDSTIQHWIREFEGQRQTAFSGHGQQVLTPEQAQI